MGRKLENYESFGKCEKTVEKILFRKNGKKLDLERIKKIEKNVILGVFQNPIEE
jgi:hypothetical protein